MSQIMRSLYSEQYDFDYILEYPRLTYMIATIPRTGSTMFALKLWRAGKYGAPLEYINMLANREIVHRIADDDYSLYWEELHRFRQTPNGVFGFKAFSQCFSTLAVKHPEVLPKIRSDHVIYLTREDKVAQAVSYAKAVQTSNWFSDTEARTDVRLTISLIDDAAQWIRRQEASWERLFILTDTHPLRLTYEAIVSDWDACLRLVNERLGLGSDVTAPIEVPILRMQRDSINDYWHHVYTEDLARRAIIAK